MRVKFPGNYRIVVDLDDGQKRELFLKKLIVLEVYGEDKYIFVEYKPLNIISWIEGEMWEMAVREFFLDLIEVYEDYVMCDTEELTRDAVELRHKLEDLMELVK